MKREEDETNHLGRESMLRGLNTHITASIKFQTCEGGHLGYSSPAELPQLTPQKTNELYPQ
jgi:hypothetical protein